MRRLLSTVPLRRQSVTSETAESSFAPASGLKRTNRAASGNADSIDQKPLPRLHGHFPEFLTAFRDRCPTLRAIAVDVEFRIEPTRVIQGTCFDKSNFGHDRSVCEDRRTTFRTEISFNRLAAIAYVVKRL